MGCKLRFTIVLVLVTLVIISGCAKKEKANDAPTPATAAAQDTSANTPVATPAEKHVMLKGVTLTPRSFDTTGFMDFINKAGQAGTIISWAGDWKELTNKKSAPFVVSDLSPKYDFTPVFEVQFFDQSTGKLLRPLDESGKKAYKDSLVSFAGAKKPAYIGIGIEVNLLSEDSPADFEEFTGFYDEMYDAVKAASPKTKVFTIFQLERMKGLKGGLFGGKSNPGDAQWELLGKFPKSDIIAFTTYPHLVFRTPEEMPSDYYSEIAKKTDKPIAFTEVGWFSTSTLEGWESTEETQASFVRLFFNNTEEINPEFAIWSFVYDQDIPEPFTSLGLINRDGTPKVAWQVWVSGS